MTATWEQYYDYYLEGRPAPKPSPRTAPPRRAGDWLARNAILKLKDDGLQVRPTAGKRRPFLVLPRLTLPPKLTAVLKLRTPTGGRAGLALLPSGVLPLSMILRSCEACGRSVHGVPGNPVARLDPVGSPHRRSPVGTASGRFVKRAGAPLQEPLPAGTGETRPKRIPRTLPPLPHFLRIVHDVPFSIRTSLWTHNVTLVSRKGRLLEGRILETTVYRFSDWPGGYRVTEPAAEPVVGRTCRPATVTNKPPQSKGRH